MMGSMLNKFTATLDQDLKDLIDDALYKAHQELGKTALDKTIPWEDRAKMLKEHNVLLRASGVSEGQTFVEVHTLNNRQIWPV